METIIRNIKLYYAGFNDDPKLIEMINFIDDVLYKIKPKVDPTWRPNSTYYFIDDVWFLEIDHKYKKYYCRYGDFWYILESNFGITSKSVSFILNYKLDKHFKDKESMNAYPLLPSEYKHIEEHFNK